MNEIRILTEQLIKLSKAKMDEIENKMDEIEPDTAEYKQLEADHGYVSTIVYSYPEG